MMKRNMRVIDKILWSLVFISVIALIILIVWENVNIRTMPLWLPISIAVYNTFFLIYYSIRRKQKKDRDELEESNKEE